MELESIWTYELFGNPVSQLIISAIVVVAVVVLAKFVYRILAFLLKGLGAGFGLKVIPRLYLLLKEPFIFSLVASGLWFALIRLELSPEFRQSLSVGYAVLIILAVSWFLARVVDAVVEHYLVPYSERTKGQLAYALPIIRRAVQIVVWGVATTIVLANLGLNVLALLTSLGIGGIALALAAQHTLSNVIAGFNILSDGHVHIGQRIQIRDVDGDMVDGTLLGVGLRTIKVRTRYEGRVISIPNSLAASHAVVNVDSETGRQRFAVYRLAPDTSLEKIQLAMDLLKSIVEENKETQERAIVALAQVSEISRDVILIYWINPDVSNLRTQTAINLEIIRRFDDNEIRFTDKAQYQHQKQVFM